MTSGRKMMVVYRAAALRQRYGSSVADRFVLRSHDVSEQIDDDEVTEGLDRINRDIIQLFAMVGEGLAGATHALLAGDREAARHLAEADAMIDRLYREVEQLAQRRLAERATGPEELRYLVVVLRMLPELERSGDLAEHVARRAIRGLGVELSPRARGLVEQMGEIACDMWHRTADAYADRSPDIDQVESLDDELDELHVLLTAEIASGSMDLPVAIEGALVARFYERLGDHAVNLSRRIAVLSGQAGATGWDVSGVSDV
ncbi:MAG TPA: PhoU domain-containing protein [Acidimicrobiales bacterium]|nr:PhoU domain-containing protein [Acidimicrobiales bacterium]